MNPTAEKKIRLVLNGEGKRVDVAILRGKEWLVHKSSPGNPLETLAPVLRSVLDEAEIKPNMIDDWIYSGGPGSLLSLRSMAMFLSVWETADPMQEINRYRYSGLVWSAREIAKAQLDQPFILLSQWRTNAWCQILHDGTTHPTEKDLSIIEGDAPESRGVPLYVLNTSLRGDPPKGATLVSPPLFESLSNHLDEPEFLRLTKTVQPIVMGTTQYRKWEFAS